MSDTTTIGYSDEVEDQAVERLSRTAKAQAAESRAADIVAEAVINGRYRHNPGMGWLRWSTTDEGGGRWEDDDTAEPRVIEEVRQFIDRTERDYRVTVTFAETTIQRITKAVNDRVATQKIADGDTEEQARATEMLLGGATNVDTYGTEQEKAEFAEASRELVTAREQADIWLNLLSANKLTNLVRLCRGMDGVITRSNEFDSHPDLMNCRNGVVDLRSGNLSPADPTLLLTHMAGGVYDPDANSATWKQALEAVHPECLTWFQTRVGQSATGHTPEDDTMVVSAGPGENGKSAVMSGIMRGLGSYARLISHRVLLASPSDHPTELTDLRGLRFALLEETPEEGHLDTHRVKTTIGTPQITARRMRKDDITFDTSHSLWVNTNFLPQVDSTDHGTWRRLKAMPWPYRFRKPGLPIETDNDRRGDLSLKTRLRYDADVPAAVIAWVVAGAVRWYATKRVPGEDPAPVTVATELWRQSSDVGYRFATERLIGEKGFFITAEVMRLQFLEMLESEGKRAWSNQTINNRLPASMEAAGIICERTPQVTSKLNDTARESLPIGDTFARKITIEPGKNYRVWKGVRFKTKDEQRGGHLKVVHRPTGTDTGGFSEPPF